MPMLRFCLILVVILAACSLPACSNDRHPFTFEREELGRLPYFFNFPADIQFTGEKMLYLSRSQEKARGPVLYQLGLVALRPKQVEVVRELRSASDEGLVISAMSNVVDGRVVLAVESATSPKGSTITFQRIHLPSGRTELESGPFQVNPFPDTVSLRQLSDGSAMAVMADTDSVLHLVRFGKNGGTMFDKIIVPKSETLRMPRWRSGALEVTEGGKICVAWALEAGEVVAFETQHKTRLPAAAGKKSSAVVACFDAMGNLLFADAPSLPEYSFPYALAIRGTTLLVAGQTPAEEVDSPFLVKWEMQPSFEKGEVKLAKKFRVSSDFDRFTSLAILPDGRLAVGGEAGYRQARAGGSIVQGGRAMLGLLDAKGEQWLALDLFGQKRRNAVETIRVVDGNTLLVSASQEGPLTHDTDGGNWQNGYMNAVYYKATLRSN